MSCIIMGIVQCFSDVLAVFIKNTIFRNLRRKSTIVYQFLQFKLRNVGDKCLYKIKKLFCINISKENMNDLDLK